MKKIGYILFYICIFSCNKIEEKQLILFAENTHLITKNGVLFYNDLPYNGIIKTFDEVNQTNNTAHYLNGKKDGEERKFFQNESLAEIRFYKTGKKIGTHKSWFENGQQKFEYPYSKKGFYNGTLKEWYANGQQVKEFNYVEGKESGTQKMWLSNGNIRANYTVINGERFGLIGLKKCYSVNTTNEK